MQQAKPDGVTPSQTVGPYFAYGLTPNGKYDWNDTFSNNLVTADTSGAVSYTHLTLPTIYSV